MPFAKNDSKPETDAIFPMHSTANDSSLFEQHEISMEHSAVGDANSSYAQGSAKQVLGELNGRLAVYIDKVRSLERENERLALKYRELEIEKREIESRKGPSSTLVNDLHMQLAQTDAARVRAEMNQKKAESETVGLRKQLERREKELQNVVADRDQLQNRLTRARNDLALSEARSANAESQLTAMKSDMTIVFQQLDIFKQQLNDETTLRIELQGRIDNELATYKALLDEEEERLHISKASDVSKENAKEGNVSTSTRVTSTRVTTSRPPASSLQFYDMKPNKRRRESQADQFKKS